MEILNYGSSTVNVLLYIMLLFLVDKFRESEDYDEAKHDG